jgi:two-component system phosphate regulon sensor histidine kinase PhoR
MKIDCAKMLVVDDELGMREGIRRIFAGQGHQVDTAENGTIGIEKGTAQEYDLYFLDLKLGDTDGVQVLQAIRAKYPEAICIIVTAYASINTAVETTRLGAYHYVAKPFTPDELQHLVDRALERRWYVLEARRLRLEQERHLLEVMHEKSRMRTIINAIDDGILVLNSLGQVVLFNPRFLSLLDLRQAVEIGQAVLDILPVSLRQQIEEIFAHRDPTKAIKQEIVVHPPDKLVIMANTAPIFDEKSQLLGVVSVLRDISEYKRLDLIKSQFVDMAAHELKAPLTAIQGYLEMVVEKTLGDASETYDGYLKRSLERNRALVSLINDLLNITRIEAGKVRRDIERLEVSVLLRQVIEKHKAEMDERALELLEKIGEELFIEADKEDIQRVFSHLLSNAIKYNKDHGRIEVSAGNEGLYVKVTIKDSGIGLKPEEKERLFEEFFRAKNKWTRKITGTGLGLAIVKKIVARYAGKIEIESEYEKGSAFTVYLPASGKK